MIEAAERHLTWAKTRALQYAHAGRLEDAIGSLLCDIAKHPGTMGIKRDILAAAESITANDPQGVVAWIEGCVIAR